MLKHTFVTITAFVMITATCSSPLLAQGGRSRVQLPTTRLAPDEYGIQDYTVTTIGAASFTPEWNDTISGPLYNTFTPYNSGVGFFRQALGIPGYFVATVSIPSGAVIDFIGLESDSEYGPDGAEVQLYVSDADDNEIPIAGFQSTGHPYDSDYNSAAIGFQLTRNVHNQLVVEVETLQGSFGWVEIWWKRTVSPAPASPTFSDVPTTDEGYQYIEALYASGITGGCGAGNFCPDANLTRRQMAIFLAKALGLHWPY